MRVYIRATDKDQWVQVTDLYSTPTKMQGPIKLEKGDYTKKCSDAGAKCQSVDLKPINGEGYIFVQSKDKEDGTYTDKNAKHVIEDEEVVVDKLP
jgi:hypothetical protein